MATEEIQTVSPLPASKRKPSAPNQAKRRSL